MDVTEALDRKHRKFATTLLPLLIGTSRSSVTRRNVTLWGSPASEAFLGFYYPSRGVPEQQNQEQFLAY